MTQLGGATVTMETSETQRVAGESVADTAAVLSSYLDGVVYRASHQEDVDELAREATIPVINGMTDKTHPCQALADVMTIRERLGRLSGVRLAYVGAGNNVCRSLMRAAAKFGMRFIAATPEGSRPAPDAIEQTRKAAIQQGGTVEFTHDPNEAVARAEVLYAAPWYGAAAVAVGHQPSEEELAPYVLSEEMLGLTLADAFVLVSIPGGMAALPLPPEIVHGPRSAWSDQAENRLHVQKALLALVIR
jgi:ornithine carbamoyltransferase